MQHVIHTVLSVYLRGVTLLFAAGGIGCAAVLVMTLWEDVKTMAGH
jgi:hypothetical protein